MTELLSIEKVTIIGILLVACVYLVKSNDTAVNKLSERHTEEENRLLAEYKEMKEERKQERKEWLEALGKNTQELNNIARKMETIPNMQHDIDSVKNDINIIKNKLSIGSN